MHEFFTNDSLCFVAEILIVVGAVDRQGTVTLVEVTVTLAGVIVTATLDAVVAETVTGSSAGGETVTLDVVATGSSAGGVTETLAGVTEIGTSTEEIVSLAAGETWAGMTGLEDGAWMTAWIVDPHVQMKVAPGGQLLPHQSGKGKTNIYVHLGMLD